MRQRVQRQEGWVWQMSLTTTPPAQLAVSPGLQVMLHKAHVPTAGALHEAPVSTFFFSAGFFFPFSVAAPAGLAASASTVHASISIRLMSPPEAFHVGLFG